MVSHFGASMEEFNEDGKPIPYYCIVLTPEEAKQVEFSELQFAKVDGKTMFEIRKDKECIGYAVYVLFRK